MELSIKELDKSKYYIIGLDILTAQSSAETASNMMNAIDKHLADNGINCVIVPFGIRQVDLLKEEKLMQIIDEQLKLHLYTEQVSIKDVANSIIKDMQ